MEFKMNRYHWFRGILALVVVLVVREMVGGCRLGLDAPPPSGADARAIPAEEATALPAAEAAGDVSATYTVQEYDVPPGTHPHDVAPAPDGTVLYTAQATGELG